MRLSLGARSDIEWWHQFTAEQNGVSILISHERSNPDVMLTSDASGKWGCGAYCGGSWFQLPWSSMLEGAHITLKELVPIALWAALWGNGWKGCTVQVRSDTSAVVAVINWGNRQDTDVMHLV